MKGTRTSRTHLLGAIPALGIAALAGHAQAQTGGGPYDPYPDTVRVTKVEQYGKQCWRIATAGGTLYFETGEVA